MTLNEEQELLTLTRDNNKMLKDIWNNLNKSGDYCNEDVKNFIMNVLANQVRI